jgi:hypothetical protein
MAVKRNHTKNILLFTFLLLFSIALLLSIRSASASNHFSRRREESKSKATAETKKDSLRGIRTQQAPQQQFHNFIERQNPSNGIIIQKPWKSQLKTRQTHTHTQMESFQQPPPIPKPPIEIRNERPLTVSQNAPITSSSSLGTSSVSTVDSSESEILGFAEDDSTEYIGLASLLNLK